VGGHQAYNGDCGYDTEDDQDDHQFDQSEPIVAAKLTLFPRDHATPLVSSPSTCTHPGTNGSSVFQRKNTIAAGPEDKKRRCARPDYILETGAAYQRDGS
jgi:hypothetical protein